MDAKYCPETIFFRSLFSIRNVSPWHVFAVVNIGSLRKEDRGQANFFCRVHEVDNVVSVLEVKATSAPPRLVRVKDSSTESGCNSP